jgi:hypothetical protein
MIHVQPRALIRAGLCKLTQNYRKSQVCKIIGKLWRFTRFFTDQDLYVKLNHFVTAGLTAEVLY